MHFLYLYINTHIFHIYTYTILGASCIDRTYIRTHSHPTSFGPICSTVLNTADYMILYVHVFYMAHFGHFEARWSCHAAKQSIFSLYTFAGNTEDEAWIEEEQVHIKLFVLRIDFADNDGCQGGKWMVNTSHRQTVVDGRMLLWWQKTSKSLGKRCLMIICIIQPCSGDLAQDRRRTWSCILDHTLTLNLEVQDWYKV